MENTKDAASYAHCHSCFGVKKRLWILNFAIDAFTAISLCEQSTHTHTKKKNSEFY